MDNRTGAVAIVVTRKDAVAKVQTVLTDFGEIIVGRMGVPNHTVERISALVGNLGRIIGVTAKSVLTPVQ